ncbi:protein SRG1 [Sesamum alatum]|uniref:Protein SRG1 n=1 Tax=Sesamum alatum TaxID=300844 RepID=A0AAE1Y151_9LAMI|nr:protein SRG1 [Sesamum alatum]
MDPKLAKLGSSLPVPVVQQLAKEKLARVPPRYVRPDQHQQRILSTLNFSFPQIPVIDMYPSDSSHTLIEEKNKFRQKEGDIEGYGRAFVVFEEQKLDWADLFYVLTSPTYLTKLHLIPQLLPTFRDAIEIYASELKILAMKILKLMAKALDMKAEEMETLFAEGMQSMRMNYYPPCPQPELITGLYPHSDTVRLTILLRQ